MDRGDKRKRGFIRMGALAIIGAFAFLTAVSLPVFRSFWTRTKEAICASNRRSLYGQLSMKKTGDELDTLEEALDAYEAEGENVLADYTCFGGGVISVEGNAVVCSIHGHEGSKIYFSGISGGEIRDHDSVLRDLSEAIPDYLKQMDRREVLSDGTLNGYWKPGETKKCTSMRLLLQAVMAENEVEYADGFSSAAVWLDRFDRATVVCVEYKIGGRAYLYFSSGNTYVLESSAATNRNHAKVDWENDERAVQDAISGGRRDVRALSAP